MTADGSITHWFKLLRLGDQQTAQPLWERYCGRMESLAGQKLGGRRFGIADSEDVALSAFDSLCRALERGRLPQLDDRSDLWRSLVVITARKIAHLVRDQRALKRTTKAEDKPADDPDTLDQIIGDEPTPEFAAQAMEEYEGLMRLLGSEELVQIATWKILPVKSPNGTAVTQIGLPKWSRVSGMISTCCSKLR